MSPFTGVGIAEIKLRSKGKSELSGRTDRPLECMHFDHTRRPDYNKAESGLRVTIVEHLAYHLYFRGNENIIGLKECTNDWAIDQLNRKCVDFFDKIGKIEQLDSEIAESLLLWESVL